jgi:hypothetical protein
MTLITETHDALHKAVRDVLKAIDGRPPHQELIRALAALETRQAEYDDALVIWESRMECLSVKLLTASAQLEKREAFEMAARAVCKAWDTGADGDLRRTLRHLSKARSEYDDALTGFVVADDPAPAEIEEAKGLTRDDLGRPYDPDDLPGHRE